MFSIEICFTLFTKNESLSAARTSQACPDAAVEYVYHCDENSACPKGFDRDRGIA